MKALVILIRLHCCSLSGKPKWNHSYGLISKLCRNRSWKSFVRAVPLEQLWQEVVNSKQNLSGRYYSGRGAVRSHSHVKVFCIIKSIDEVAVNDKSVCAAPVHGNASCRLCCSWTRVWGKRMEMMWLFGLFFNICQVCLYCFWTGVRRRKKWNEGGRRAKHRAIFPVFREEHKQVIVMDVRKTLVSIFPDAALW